MTGQNEDRTRRDLNTESISGADQSPLNTIGFSFEPLYHEDRAWGDGDGYRGIILTILPI